MPYAILGDLQTLELGAGVSMENACCILTLDCTVQLMGNATLAGYVTDSVMATLPESMAPAHDVYVGAWLRAADGNMSIVPLHVNGSGELSVHTDVANGTLYLNGVEFNVCDQYYNAEIGNNFSQGTSPLS